MMTFLYVCAALTRQQPQPQSQQGAGSRSRRQAVAAGSKQSQQAVAAGSQPPAASRRSRRPAANSKQPCSLLCHFASWRVHTLVTHFPRRRAGSRIAPPPRSEGAATEPDANARGLAGVCPVATTSEFLAPESASTEAAD